METNRLTGCFSHSLAKKFPMFIKSLCSLSSLGTFQSSGEDMFCYVALNQAPQFFTVCSHSSCSLTMP